MGFWKKRRRPSEGVRRRQSGFGMIDVLMAMTIMTATVAGVTTMIGTMMQLNHLSNEAMVATTLGRNWFELLRPREPDELLALDDTSGTEGPFDGTGASDPAGRYWVKWELREGTETLNYLDITVYWYDESGDYHDVSMTSALRSPTTSGSLEIIPIPGQMVTSDGTGV